MSYNGTESELIRQYCRQEQTQYQPVERQSINIHKTHTLTNTQAQATNTKGKTNVYDYLILPFLHKCGVFMTDDTNTKTFLLLALNIIITPVCCNTKSKQTNK